MSCSQFIEHEDEDESDTLVIIVNGDGTVSLDEITFKRVLRNQCRSAVSVVQFEDLNEPDSQPEKLRSEKNEKSSDEKDSFCHKVNLVVQGYYPPPPLKSNNKSDMSADSVVSSTVGTPPLPQTSSEFLDLLAEGLEIPESQSNVQTSVEGCIGDSLVDAFSELAPEQLKQVETVLHSEKAKQILGDGVTSVLDTLNMADDDDWVHFDHCYTANYYGNRKSNQKLENIIAQDSADGMLPTIKVKPENDSIADSGMSEIDEIYETLNDVTLEGSQKPATKKKCDTDINLTGLKKTVLGDVKSLIHTIKEKRSPIHIISKVKKKSSSKSDLVDDEVDGVKVFKPTKSDKRLPKQFSLMKDNAGNVTPNKNQLVQTKLNFVKKDDANDAIKKQISVSDSECPSASQASKTGASKKDAARKPATPEIFGPALFSTPDIIRKIGTEDAIKESCNVSAIDTADLEKRMSAIENGEILEHISLPYIDQTSTKIEEDDAHLQDDSRLLSDLENSADESSQVDKMGGDLSSSLSDLEMSRRRSGESEQSDFSDKNDVEYEDDPNKLWCICNKPHNNRFMICCDACDNWFHGYCVGITKAMGEKMEQKGTEWLCPNCKKEKMTNERGTKQKLSTRSVSGRNVSKRRNSQTGGESSASNISTSSTPVNMSPAPASVANERPATNQSAASARRKSSSQPTKSSSVQICIECKENEAMPEGLYCSNACIVRYVAASVENMNRGLTEPLPDDQKIIVVDKKRDQLITGMRGPSISELRSWLADHPSFEIVKPSAFPIFKAAVFPRETKPTLKPSIDTQKAAVVKKEVQNPAPVKAKPQPQSQPQTQPPPPKPKIMDSVETAQTSIKQFFTAKSVNEEKPKVKKLIDSSGNTIIREGNVLKLNEVKRDSQPKIKEKEKQRQIKMIPAQPIQKPIEDIRMNTMTKPVPAPKPTTPITKKPSVTTPVGEKSQPVAVKRKAEPPKKDKPPAKKPELKRQDSKKTDEDSTPSATPVKSGASERERIRKSIRDALIELFTLRIKDVKDITVHAEELSELATQVEAELFNLFNDTSTKYKSKYRSLRFNIKDEKNNLFRRIAEKSLKPYDLVRLTPEELASTELAQWREREAKHEIDMIKKTELENLSQAKVLVLKTHKGELEIEPQAIPTMPDTVVPDLQPDELPVEADKSKKLIPQVLSKEKAKSEAKDKDSSKKDRDKDRSKKHDHKDKHKSSSSHKHRRRSSERDRHRSRSRRRSKSKERGKSSEKDHHRSKTSVDKKHDGKNSDKDRHRSRNEKHRSRSRSTRKEKTPEKKDEVTAPATPASESLQVEETPKREPSVETTRDKNGAIIINKEDEKIAAELLSSYNAVDVDLSDMEPTSTVTIQTPPYAASPELPSCAWKGMLIMPDVIKMHTMLKEVSGNCEGLDEDLPAVIDCVGRINPNMVWEYISKTKKTGSREILVLRFEAVDDEQRANYFTLYSYLNRKDRMAVVRSTSQSIKDFYVIPLAGHNPIPQVLLPLDGPGFDDSRSHMLLAVIVRSRRHSHMASLLPPPLPSTTPQPKKEKEPSTPVAASTYTTSQAGQSETFTPPHSPTSVFVGASVPSPTIAVAHNDEEDEPYSPEDDEPYSPGALDEEHENDASLDLQREMEALNRKIEEQKQQIESISSSLPKEESTELYSPTEHLNTEADTSSIQLPGDLQQLLNSLNKRASDPSSNSLSLPIDPIVDAYKKNVENSEEEEEEDEDDDNDLPPHFSPPDIEDEPEPEPQLQPETENTPQPEVPTQIELPEPVDETRVSRDPRRKLVPVPVAAAVEPFRMLTSSQPPPPGMEDEFALGNLSASTSTKSDVVPTMVDPAYVTAVPTAPYGYPTGAPITAYPPPNMMAAVPPMYIATPGLYPQPTALPFAAIPPQQMYMPPTAVVPADPSMIPLPVEPVDGKNSLKRKAQDDERDKDKDRRSGMKGKKHYRESKSPPGRDGSSGYDPHHRGYRRDDVEYGGNSSHSRYGHRHDSRNYNQSRSRSGYWKGGSDYSSSSSSSSRRKYSERRSSSRERSSSRHSSSRWDGEGQKREKSDRKSESRKS